MRKVDFPFELIFEEITFSFDFSGKQNYYGKPNALPFGWWGSVIAPSLFALGVAGLVLAYANSDEVKQRNKKTAVDSYLYENKSDSAIMKWWNSINPGQKVLSEIIGLNTIIFCLWNL